MERIPVETWHIIFAYACIDGGFTARALSRTCRYFREASKLVRYQSLKLEGLHQLHAFYAIAANEACLGIRSLFISDVTPASSGDSEDAGQQPAALRGRWPREQVQERDALIKTILAIAVQTLEILFLDLRHGRNYLFAPADLPVLRELTVYGTYDSSTDSITAALQPFAQLRRLHFNGSYDILSQGSNLVAALAEVNRLAPSLTHLGCTDGNIIQLHQIASALGIVSNSRPIRDSIPRTVTHIYFNDQRLVHLMYSQGARSLRSLVVREASRKTTSNEEVLKCWSAATQGQEWFWASAVNIALWNRNFPRLDRLHLMI
ncbi:hypothetical protein OE88DRAFT_399216 [Heliocybe sulcata]|uniref:F-box domain-containing protein n=1 Tax=Heliocybe sulcata TaxID=5364 RepID=A0A5C3MV64_9AGAM|nr:hypothetical protein OE88DRAFT_399216 [Heliocybe sulcata]